MPIFAMHLKIKHGAIAQLVEQRTENPCVPGSIPGGTTLKSCKSLDLQLFLFLRGLKSDFCKSFYTVFHRLCKP